MTKVIGLTGGIGSGKSTIASFFQKEGVPIYIADTEARRIMTTNNVVSAIKDAFGSNIFINNVLQRDQLAAIVFNDNKKLETLNAIVHPAVKRDFKDWLYQNREAPLVVYESALLFEGGTAAEFDVIITVTAPKEVIIARVIARDGSTKEQVLKLMAAQWTDEERLNKSHYQIENTDLKVAELKTNEILKILRIKQKEM